ncbi:MAG: type II toxin-antitoxin system Phd/YefM family antitoxin [Coriobacteriaceae bacterium]|nr:type II toxin-antitoxin system Phd/YefM family antitoxin [Coriobacteriaceae bacterium]
MATTCTVEELKAHPEAILDEVRSTRTPTYIDQKGTASVLLLDADVYLTQVQALNEFMRIYTDDTSGRPTDLAMQAAIAAAEEEAKAKKKETAKKTKKKA